MSWDDEDFTPEEISVPASRYGDEDVKDSWEDVEVEDNKEAETSEASKEEDKKKEDKGKSKGKGKKGSKNVIGSDKNIEEEKKLTGKELEELQRKRDLELTQDMFGAGDEFKFETEDDAKNLADKVASKLRDSFQDSEHYKAFLSDLFYKLCHQITDPALVRRLSQELSALGNDIQDRQRKQKNQTKAKGKYLAPKSNQGIMDDVIDGEFAGADDAYVDMEDFM